MSWNKLYQQSDKYMRECCWWEGYWKRKFANHKRACLRANLLTYLDCDQRVRQAIQKGMSEADVKKAFIEVGV